MRRICLVALFLALSCGFNVWADDVEEAKSIRELVQQMMVDEAEGVFQKAIQEWPGSEALAAVRPILFSAHSRAGQWAQAAEHATANHSRVLKQLRDGKVPPGQIVQSASMAGSSLLRSDQLEQSVALYEEALAVVVGQAQDTG
ncbi:MAG: hypothetical protein EHM42_06510, partial [Planctomycetaceae bacterium]